MQFGVKVLLQNIMKQILKYIFKCKMQQSRILRQHLPCLFAQFTFLTKHIFLYSFLFIFLYSSVLFPSPLRFSFPTGPFFKCVSSSSPVDKMSHFVPIYQRPRQEQTTGREDADNVLSQRQAVCLTTCCLIVFLTNPAFTCFTVITINITLLERRMLTFFRSEVIKGRCMK